MTFDYQAEAMLTLSDSYHGGKVTLAAFRDILTRFIAVGNELDAAKKALFYGKGNDIGLTAGTAQTMADATVMMWPESDALSIHQMAIAETILHAIVGQATESVELVERLVSLIWGTPKLDDAQAITNLKEEFGDGFWYAAIGLTALGSTFDEEQRRNIAKLRARFPNNFTEYDANNRDLAKENTFLSADYKKHLESVSEAGAIEMIKLKHGIETRDDLGLPLANTTSRPKTALERATDSLRADDQKAAHEAAHPVGNNITGGQDFD